VLLEEMLGIEGGHAAGAGRGDGLSVDRVLDVAAGIYAGHTSGDTLSNYVTFSIELKVAFE